MAPEATLAEGGTMKSEVGISPAGTGCMRAPDRVAFEAELTKIQDAIECLRVKQQPFAAKISERSGGDGDFFAKQAELGRQLREFTSKIIALAERKHKLNKLIGDRRQELHDDIEGDCKRQIKNIEEEMALCRAGQRDVQEKLKELREARSEDTGNLSQIMRRQGAVRRQIAQKFKEMDDLRAEFKEKERKFKQHLAEQPAQPSDPLDVDLDKDVEVDPYDDFEEDDDVNDSRR